MPVLIDFPVLKSLTLTLQHPLSLQSSPTLSGNNKQNAITCLKGYYFSYELGLIGYHFDSGFL